jgi:acyl carrier protein
MSSQPDHFDLVCDAILHAASHDLPSSIEPQHSLIEDLGYDSLTISVLALELESRLGRPVLLSRWVEAVDDPSGLTVQSLCEYLEHE